MQIINDTIRAYGNGVGIFFLKIIRCPRPLFTFGGGGMGTSICWFFPSTIRVG